MKYMEKEKQIFLFPPNVTTLTDESAITHII